jgi:hypothetical protein
MAQDCRQKTHKVKDRALFKRPFVAAASSLRGGNQSTNAAPAPKF